MNTDNTKHTVELPYPSMQVWEGEPVEVPGACDLPDVRCGGGMLLDPDDLKEGDVVVILVSPPKNDYTEDCRLGIVHGYDAQRERLLLHLMYNSLDHDSSKRVRRDAVISTAPPDVATGWNNYSFASDPAEERYASDWMPCLYPPTAEDLLLAAEAFGPLANREPKRYIPILASLMRKLSVTYSEVQQRFSRVLSCHTEAMLRHIDQITSGPKGCG